MTHPNLILASSSIYRRELLEHLQIPFSVISPDIDETPLPDEKPEETALRLAKEAEDLANAESAPPQKPTRARKKKPA